MTDTIRTFIAVRIPSGPRLQRVLNELRAIGPPVRTVPDEHLHVTLKFFGDIARDRADEISHLLHDICSPHSPFGITIRGMDAFPNTERPSVIWAGLSGAEPLVEIVDQIERASATLGFPPEQRPFHPHLTLARVRTARGAGTRIPVPLQQLIQDFRDREFAQIDVHQIVLFHSQRTHDGLKYSELAAADLAP